MTICKVAISLSAGGERSVLHNVVYRHLSPHMNFNSKNSKDIAKDRLKAFTSADPKGQYTFDSERDSPQSRICRNTSNGQECVTLELEAKQMFSEMQALGFFCALPNDPAKTFMLCKPLRQ